MFEDVIHEFSVDNFILFVLKLEFPNCLSSDEISYYLCNCLLKILLVHQKAYLHFFLIFIFIGSFPSTTEKRWYVLCISMTPCPLFLCKQLLRFGTFRSNFATITTKIFEISIRDGICDVFFSIIGSVLICKSAIFLQHKCIYARL